ncbi:MAG: thymidine phosphorylase [Gemmatimonadota bacterium]|jgi:pyrimidine-nucleoside phosphorylase
MIPSSIIEKKREGNPVPAQELEAFFQAYLDGGVEDYHMAAFLMAVYFQGLDATETDVVVRSMLASGSTLDLSYLDGPRIDKHSTGGVGDKVSLVLAPLAAELGLYVPMMSGRGLGHTAGTLDKLEAIPGFTTDLTLDEFRGVLGAVGCAMIGQTAEIAPLDKRLYALRDVTGTVPAIPLIAASIMSKKLAEGLSGLVLDVKVGGGAFIPGEDRALDLARTMVEIGSARSLPTVALLTAMDRPLGRAVGNGLETREAVLCLRGEGPEDLTELVVAEAAEMACLGWPALSSEEAGLRAREALDSGRALERFIRMVEAQGGDPSVVDRPDTLATAALRAPVEAGERGTVEAVDPRALGKGVVSLGGGRSRMDEDIDLGVGFELEVRPGDHVVPGDVLGTVHARDEAGLVSGRRILREAVRVGSGTPDLRSMISHRVTVEGVTSL